MDYDLRVDRLLEHIASVFACVASVGEALDMCEEPVDEIGARERLGKDELEPMVIADVEARAGGGHGAHHRVHVRVGRQVEARRGGRVARRRRLQRVAQHLLLLHLLLTPMLQLLLIDLLLLLLLVMRMIVSIVLLLLLLLLLVVVLMMATVGAAAVDVTGLVVDIAGERGVVAATAVDGRGQRAGRAERRYGLIDEPLVLLLFVVVGVVRVRLGVCDPGGGVDGPHGLLLGDGEVALGIGIPALGHDELDGAGLHDRLAEDAHRVVVGHVLETRFVHLEDHVAGLDAAVLGDGAAAHYGAHVDAALAALVALADDADAEEVDRVQVERHRDDVQRHGRLAAQARHRRVQRRVLASQSIVLLLLVQLRRTWRHWRSTSGTATGSDTSATTA